jgi:hypothetical protein
MFSVKAHSPRVWKQWTRLPMLYVKTRCRGPVYLLSSPWQGIPEADGTLGNTATNEKHAHIISVQSSTVRNGAAHCCRLLYTAVPSHRRPPPGPIKCPTIHRSCSDPHYITHMRQWTRRIKEGRGNSSDLSGGASLKLALAPRVWRGGGKRAKHQAEMWILELPTQRLGYTKSTVLFNLLRTTINLNHIFKHPVRTAQ